jgi:GntP family gluconate:H+ symporter
MPVFFDMVFYLLAPLVRAAYARRRRDYALMVCAAAAGGAITHALVPPTPGPILVSEALGVPIGLTVGMGTLLALVPALIGGVVYANFINRRLEIVPREVYGESIEQLEKQARRPESELPSLAASLAPVVIPVGLIALSTAGPLLLGQGSPLARTLELVGDKDLAFLLGAALGIWLVASRPGVRLRDVTSSLEPAVVSGTSIAFITCAGGSFGRVLTDSGVGGLIASAAQEWGLSLMLLAFLCAALIRVAQGSATVAMVTTAGIVAPTLAVTDPGFHPVYLVAAIGYGATTTSWMNDSGFWIVCKMAGLSESETLKTWTVLLTVVAVTGFLWVRLVAWIFPLT